MKQTIPTAYANYKQYAVRYDLTHDTFSCTVAGRGTVVADAGIRQVCLHGKKVFDLSDYRKRQFFWSEEMDAALLRLVYGDGPAEQPELALTFRIDRGGIHLRMECRGDLDFHFAGRLLWGSAESGDTFAVCLDRPGQDLRAALGPASSTIDNALFDRQRDEALEFYGGPPVRLQYDWTEQAYRFALSTEGNDYVRGFSLRVRSRIYAERFDIAYRPINKRSTFPTPPAGWMTWYAVQFDAGAETVLANAAWQAKHLLPFGAQALWVDWEWYHSDFSGIGKPDADTFHPDPRRYPDGLAPIAAAISQMGLVPCLWVGFTNDPTENELIRENPDMVLVDKPSWCGRYFLDPTHPRYRDAFLPRAFAQLKAWGYKAFKWDCLPITLQMLDKYHDGLAEPELTSEEALRTALQTARSIVGPDFYMLSCSGHTQRDITVGADLFDAARIGGDIFKWEEFISQCVARVMKFYACHNVLFYNDPDNVILRAKFNTFDQAVSRLSFVALLGLPITLGDPLPDLPEERIELLRRGLPPIDAHPMDIRQTVLDSRIVTVNLAIERPFERWNVVLVLNLSDQPAEMSLDLQADLHLAQGRYHLFDFWAQTYLGASDKVVPLSLAPHASRVLAVRQQQGRPQVLSTSRHITQGGVDLTELSWDEADGLLSAVSRLVPGDPYTVYLHVPPGYRPFCEGNRTTVPVLEPVGGSVWRFTLDTTSPDEVAWSVAFVNPHPGTEVT
jgi:hypothetical protein